MRRNRMDDAYFPVAKEGVNAHPEGRRKHYCCVVYQDRPAAGSGWATLRVVLRPNVNYLPPQQLLLLVLLLVGSAGLCSGFNFALKATPLTPFRVPTTGDLTPFFQRRQHRGRRSLESQTAIPQRRTAALHAVGAPGDRHDASDADTRRQQGKQVQQQEPHEQQEQQPPSAPQRKRRELLQGGRPRPYGAAGGAETQRQRSTPISIESIAAALESGRSQTAVVNGIPGSQNQEYAANQPWRRSDPDGREARSGSARYRQAFDGQGFDSRGVEGDALGGRGSNRAEHNQNGLTAAGARSASPDPSLSAGNMRGGGTGGGKRSKGNPNKVSLKKRRARDRTQQTLEEKQLQNDVAAALKADSAEETLRSFNAAMTKGVPLRANLLSGVLNQCAKAGLMDDCKRVVVEMKERGMVIEENTFVPLIRGMVSHGACRGAFDLVRDMVNQGVQPRLRCYEPVIAGFCREGEVDATEEVWEHMAQQGVVPREEQYVNYFCGLGIAGRLWETARSGKLDDKLLEMSYHARNLTMEQVGQLEHHFNALPAVPVPLSINGDNGEEAEAIVARAKSSAPLARRVKVPGGHEIDDDSWTRDWSSTKPVMAEPDSCPACGGMLKAVGLTSGERARIRETLFGLAGLQVKKHAKSRHTKILAKNRRRQDGSVGNNPFYSFTEEDQKEQLQIFVDWLHSQRADGKTYTAVIDSANVAYHKGSAFHFSVPQVDLMVQALEAKGERPLVVIAEKYIDRIGDPEDNTAGFGNFKYMCNPLNKAIVQRWRAKSQLYECSDEASDDWYWMYAAVAFDDIPMTVISNDRTRDHRMSLAETVPYLRWRTTQLAQFELTYALKDFTGKNPPKWPRNPPQVAIQPPPTFTRDIQRSDQGCWHVPAGADDEWLCIDVPRGLEIGLDKLMPVQRMKPSSRDSEVPERAINGDPSGRATATVNGDGAPIDEDDKLREVGGLLQSMPVRKNHGRTVRYSTQGTVEEAAMVAKQAAAKARAESAAADELVAEALFADAQTDGGLPPGSPWADVLAADTVKVNSRLAEVRFSARMSEDGVMGVSPGEQRPERGGDRSQPQQMKQEAVGMVGDDEGASVSPSTSRSSSTGRTEVTATAPARAPTAGMATVNAVGSAPEAAVVDTVAATTAPVAVSTLQEVRDSEESPRGGRGGAMKEKEAGSSQARATRNRGEDFGNAPDVGNVDDPQKGLGGVTEGVRDINGADADNERQQERQLASMTVVALKEELRQRGLKVSGKKAELVERLLRA